MAGGKRRRSSGGGGAAQRGGRAAPAPAGGGGGAGGGPRCGVLLRPGAAGVALEGRAWVRVVRGRVALGGGAEAAAGAPPVPCGGARGFGAGVPVLRAAGGPEAAAAVELFDFPGGGAPAPADPAVAPAWLASVEAEGSVPWWVPGGGGAPPGGSTFRCTFLSGGPGASPALLAALEREPPRAWARGLEEAAEALERACLRGAPLRGRTAAVLGPKGAGKSALARLLVNRLLARCPCVAFVDTDCGQPEFTPPGLVSVTLVSQPVSGPPHLHPTFGAPAAAAGGAATARAFFVGDTTPRSDPGRYLALCAELRRFLEEGGAAAAAAHLAQQGRAGVDGRGADAARGRRGTWGSAALPVVVNTHGWVRGLGLDLLSDLLRALDPNVVLTLGQGPAAKDLPPGCFWGEADAGPGAGGAWVLALPAFGAGGGPDEGGASAPATPAEARGAMWLSFARACVGGEGGQDEVDGDGGASCSCPPLSSGCPGPRDYEAGATALARCPPLKAALDDLPVLDALGDAPLGDPASRLRALNCSLVGLLGEPPAAGGAAPCLGLALVRAVDPAAGGRVLLLSPCGDAEVEAGVRSLALGRLALPPALLQGGGFHSPYLALGSIQAVGSGSAAMRSRNNLQRAGGGGG